MNRGKAEIFDFNGNTELVTFPLPPPLPPFRNFIYPLRWH